MKTIKILLANLALLFVCGAMQAQVTPQAVIGQCPDLPSAATLATAANDSESAAYRTVSEFLERIKALDKQYAGSNDASLNISEAELSSAMTQHVADTEKQLKAKTGKSIAEIQSMSSAEQEALGKKMQQQALKDVEQRMAGAQQQMAAAGMGNISLADMQNMSEDQLMAKMAGNTGLTVEEMKALEGMNDKQAEAYMKQGDRMQRFMNSSAGKAAANAPVNSSENQFDLSEAEMNALQTAPQEQQKFVERVGEMDKLHARERREVVAKISEVYRKHAPAISDAFDKYSVCLDGKTPEYATKEYCDAARKRYLATLIPCDTEAYTLWRNQIAKEQGRYKTLLSDAARVDDLQEQSAKAQAKINKNAMSGITTKIGAVKMNAINVVNAYLNTAASVINYPEPREE
jgi:hypothetical protein